MHRKQQRSSSSNARLRLGYVPLTDCAPIIMAHELDLFSKHGIEVELVREVGWATIRDKIIHRELEAAHATAGLGSIRADIFHQATKPNAANTK